jgi:hypothetical protein
MLKEKEKSPYIEEVVVLAIRKQSVGRHVLQLLPFRVAQQQVSRILQILKSCGNKFMYIQQSNKTKTKQKLYKLPIHRSINPSINLLIVLLGNRLQRARNRLAA